MAGVPEGPYSLPEIESFRRHLPDYCLVVLSLDHNHQIIYKGPICDTNKEIILIKAGEHYHGCTSISGFLGRNRSCLHCEKGYDYDDMKHHPCQGKKCFACYQSKCEDYRRAGGESATLECNRCQRSFLGDQCMQNHYVYASTDEKKADPAKKIKMCVPLDASVRPAIDYSEHASWKRDTCVEPPNVLLAKNITISAFINVTYKIPPN